MCTGRVGGLTLLHQDHESLLRTVLLVAFLEKTFVKLKYCLFCFITNSDKVSRQWILGEAGADILQWWKGHSWAYGHERAAGRWCVRQEGAAGHWCAVYYLCSLAQGWWCLAPGTISVVSIKTFPFFATLWPKATPLCICSPSWLWMGLGLNRGHRFWMNVLQWSNEQVQILSPQKICSSGTQSTDPARSQSYIRPGWLGREKCPKKAAQGT